MATLLTRELGKQDIHTVGNLVSSRKYIKDFANGGKYKEDVDNFHLVQGEFSATDGELEVGYLTDETLTREDLVFLSAGVERRYLPIEQLGSFFNGKGDKERIVYLTQGLLFDTSAYEVDASITAKGIETGDKVHYDVAKKTFVISDGSAAGYATAGIKMLVRRSEADVAFTLGQPTVRLLVL